MPTSTVGRLTPPATHVIRWALLLALLASMSACGYGGRGPLPHYASPLDEAFYLLEHLQIDEGQGAPDGWPEPAPDDGCPVRESVLVRDLAATTMLDSCRVSTGTLIWDRYSGRDELPFRRQDNPATITVDPIVSFDYAWSHGLGRQDPAVQQRFVRNNSGGVATLTVVSVAGARDRAGRPPSEWLPPYRDWYSLCGVYLHDYLNVLDQFGLTISRADYQAVRSQLRSCRHTS